MKTLLAALALVTLGGSASAQIVFKSVLNGGQATPVAATPQTGSATLYYDDATNALSYTLNLSGITGSITAAQIAGPAAPGVSATALFPLVGGPLNFAGTVTLSPAQEISLINGLLSITVTTTGFPTGELRGQIARGEKAFASRLFGSYVVPAIPSSSFAFAELTINADKSVTYLVSGAFTGNPTTATVNDGVVGATGPVLFNLVKTSFDTFSGTTAPLPDVTLAKIRSGRTYVVVNSTTFIFGDARGQIRGAWLPYESGCNLGGTGSLAGSGPPLPGASLTLTISGCVPSSAGILFYGLGSLKSPFAYGCNFLIAPPLILTIPIAVGPSGSVSLPVTLPGDSPFPVDISLQYFGSAPSEPGGFQSTNGLVLHIDG